MFNLVYAELLKLKRSKIWWLIFAASILPGQLDIIVVLDEQANQHLGAAERLFFNNQSLLDLPMMQLVFSVVVGYVFAREYIDRTINTLLTYPFPRRQVYYSKMIVLLLIMMVFFVTAYLSVLSVVWMFLGSAMSWELAVRHLGLYLLSAVLNYALIPVYGLVALIWKQIVPSIVVGISMMVVNGFLLLTQYAAWSPWNLPLLLKVSLTDQPAMPQYRLEDPVMAAAGLVLMFLVPVVASILYLEKSDVQSGT